MADVNRMLTVLEVAERLRIGRSSAYQLIKQTDFPVVRIGAAIRIPEDRLQAWVDDRTGQTRSGD